MNTRDKKPRAYPTDVEIPNLDDMMPSELAEHAEAMEALWESEPKGSPTREWLRLSARYARMKLKAMNLRLEGKIDVAMRYERECDNIYKMIPARMKW